MPRRIAIHHIDPQQAQRSVSSNASLNPCTSPASISFNKGCAGSPHALLAITGIPMASAFRASRGSCSTHAGITKPAQSGKSSGLAGRCLTPFSKSPIPSFARPRINKSRSEPRNASAISKIPFLPRADAGKNQLLLFSKGIARMSDSGSCQSNRMDFDPKCPAIPRCGVTIRAEAARASRSA